jgi:hypothetical protein
VPGQRRLLVSLFGSNSINEKFVHPQDKADVIEKRTVTFLRHNFLKNLAVFFQAKLKPEISAIWQLWHIFCFSLLA